MLGLLDMSLGRRDLLIELSDDVPWNQIFALKRLTQLFDLITIPFSRARKLLELIVPIGEEAVVMLHSRSAPLLFSLKVTFSGRESLLPCTRLLLELVNLAALELDDIFAASIAGRASLLNIEGNRAVFSHSDALLVAALTLSHSVDWSVESA